MLAQFKIAENLRPIREEDFVGKHNIRPLAQVAFFGIARQIATVVMQIASFLILSRLLSPDVFGLLVMVTFFRGILEIFSGAGFADAAVQKKDLETGELNRVFRLNAILCTILAVAFIACADVVQNFYGKENLGPIFVPIAASFLFQYTFRPHDALLRRAMRSEALFIISLISQTLNLTVSVGMALMGYGIWSLIGGTLAMASSSAVLHLYFVRWNPFKFGNSSNSKDMFRYGIRSSIAGIINYFAENTQNVALGKEASSAAVGYYNRGQTLLLLPIHQISQPIAQMILPALSALQEERDKLYQLLRNANGVIFILTAPYAAFCFIFGEAFVEIALGPEWAESGKIAQWLGLASIPVIASSILPQGNAAIGRPGRGIPIVLLSLPLLISGIFYYAPHGAVAVAKFYMLYRFILYPFSTLYHLHGSGLDSRAYIRNQFFLFASACCILCILYIIQTASTHMPGIHTGIWLLIAITSAYVSIWLAFRNFQDGRFILDWLYTNVGAKFRIPKSIFY